VTAVAGLRFVLPLYMVAAVAIGFVDYRSRAHVDRGFGAYSQGVVANTEEPPGKYRVLAPFVFEEVVHLTGWDRRIAWVAFRWGLLVAAFAGLHVFLSTWAPAAAAVGGTLGAGVLLLLTFTNSWPHPDHFVEFALTAAGAAAIARRADGWFTLWLILAALNRETSAFLLLWYAAARPTTRAHLVRTALLGAGWAAVYFGLRAWRGVAWYDPWQLNRNLDFLGLLPADFDPYARAYAWFGLVLIAPAVWFGIRSWHRLPRMLQTGLAVVVPSFFVTALCFSSLVEARIFTPLIPLVAAIIMLALKPADSSTVEDL